MVPSVVKAGPHQVPRVTGLPPCPVPPTRHGQAPFSPLRVTLSPCVAFWPLSGWSHLVAMTHSWCEEVQARHSVPHCPPMVEVDPLFPLRPSLPLWVFRQRVVRGADQGCHGPMMGRRYGPLWPAALHRPWMWEMCPLLDPSPPGNHRTITSCCLEGHLPLPWAQLSNARTPAGCPDSPRVFYQVLSASSPGMTPAPRHAVTWAQSRTGLGPPSGW